MRPFFLLLCLLLVFAPTQAIGEANNPPTIDPETYPTYYQLQEIVIPPINRVDLAQRLLGITYEVDPMIAPPEREIGDMRTFRLTTVQGGGTADIDAELRVVGEHSFIWVDTAMTTSQDNIEAFSQRFDDEVYDLVADFWGAPSTAGIDGEEGIHLLFSSQVSNNVAGFYSSTNSSARAIAPNSNELDMLIMNGFLLQPQYLEDSLSIATHELQHFFHYVTDTNEDLWLNEGFSMLSQHLADTQSNQFFVNEFANNPDNQLTTFGLSNNVAVDYGASTAFLVYLYDRYGLDFMQTIATDTSNGLLSVDSALRANNQPSVDTIFADWVVASLARQDDSIYGYSTLPDVDAMALEDSFDDYPIDVTDDTAQYSTHYYLLEDVSSSFTLTFDADESIPLIDISPVVGDSMWYSQRGDNSNPYLTFNADLTNTVQAQLNFYLWYDLEDNWDYGYITISTDNGRTWELYTTPEMTNSDDNGRAYGIGYTDTLNDWIVQQIDLSDYIGQEVLIRFEMVTDDGVNQQGIALHNVLLTRDDEQTAITPIDDLSAGWIQTDNRLPQQFWVQVIEHQGDDIILTRYLVRGDSNTWAFDTHPETDYITLAISPFAPMTTQSASYRLQVE